MKASAITIPLLLALAVPPASASETVTLDAASLSRAGIVVRPVLERPFGDQVRVFGEVVRAPGAAITVKAPVRTRVLELEARPGRSVKAGETILTLHSHELFELEGEVMRRREEKRYAESRVEAGRQLYEIEGIAKIELEERQRAAVAARIEYEEALEELHDIGFREEDVTALLEHATPRGRLSVRAPADGVVLELRVEEHEWVEAFEPLMVLGDPDRVELEIRVQPVDSSRVALGDRIDFVPVGHPELAGRARVLTPIPTVERESRTVKVRAEIQESAGPLYPGVFVEGVLIHGEAKTCPSVPESAVTRIGAGDYVFVQRSPGEFEARAVRLGRFNETRYEVLEGVATGEEVVVQGTFFLKSALLQGGGE